MTSFAFDIRPLAPADQDFLWEMLHIALWDPPPTPLRPRSVLDHPFIAVFAKDWGASPDDLGFAACLPDGTSIGAAWSRLLVPPNFGGAYLDEHTPQLGIAVLPEYHRQGVGSALMARYLTAASERYQAVTLSVHPENHARLLYEKHGFSQYDTGNGGYWQMIRRFEPSSETPLSVGKDTHGQTGF